MLEGLPPNNATHRMELTCAATEARRVADLIVETFDPTETAATAFALEPDKPTGPWRVEVYFARAPDEAVVRSLIAVASDETLAAAAVFGAVAAVDWVAASLEGLEAVRVGRFVVHGAHGRDRVRTGDIGIEIEAALAFGTGHHGTTRGCLMMLEDVARRRRPQCILDVGTGTGVLAIAAARRFNRIVAAGDIDPIAVTTARQNAIHNGAGARVRPVRAAGLAHPDLRRHAPYDLVLANILARPLRGLAPHLRQVMAPAGEIILSGLLASDVPGVLSSYRSQGFVLRRRSDLEGWATLLMARPVNSF
jgi:ribosomal protein L11 methyltransferase